MSFVSKLINESADKVPEGKLEPGGYYSWAVHAHEFNERVLSGDFHMGQ